MELASTAFESCFFRQLAEAFCPVPIESDGSIACVRGIDSDPETFGCGSPEGIVDFSSLDLGDFEAGARQKPVSLIDVIVHQIKRRFLLPLVAPLSPLSLGDT